MNSTIDEKLEHDAYRVQMKKSTKFVLQFNIAIDSDFALKTLNETLNEIEMREFSTTVDAVFDIQLSAIQFNDEHDLAKAKLNSQAQINELESATINDQVTMNLDRSKSTASFFKMSMQIDTYEEINNTMID